MCGQQKEGYGGIQPHVQTLRSHGSTPSSLVCPKVRKREERRIGIAHVLDASVFPFSILIRLQCRPVVGCTCYSPEREAGADVPVGLDNGKQCRVETQPGRRVSTSIHHGNQRVVVPMCLAGPY